MSVMGRPKTGDAPARESRGVVDPVSRSLFVLEVDRVGDHDLATFRLGEGERAVDAEDAGADLRVGHRAAGEVRRFDRAGGVDDEADRDGTLEARVLLEAL